MLSALNVWGCLLRNVAKFCVALSVDYSSSDVASSKDNIHDFLLKLVSKKDEGHIDFLPENF